MTGDPIVEVEMTYLSDSPAAWLARDSAGVTTFMIKGCTHVGPSPGEGDAVFFLMPLWIAEVKKLMTASTAERRYMKHVVALGCAICGSPAEIHHILEGRHSQRRSSHWHVIPLCPLHHRTGGIGEAVHAGPSAWRDINGSEITMAAQIQTRVKQAFGFAIPEGERL